MIIVAGHLLVRPQEREQYLEGCAGVVAQGRAAAGCLDFSIAADPLESGRINVFERWETTADVEAFRGSGPTGEQAGAIESASVAQYEVAGVYQLTG